MKISIVNCGRKKNLTLFHKFNSTQNNNRNNKKSPLPLKGNFLRGSYIYLFTVWIVDCFTSE